MSEIWRAYFQRGEGGAYYWNFMESCQTVTGKCVVLQDNFTSLAEF